MNTYELAAQLWQVLISAAHNRQVLTYELAGKPLGLGTNTLSSHLGQIQSYCERNKLPLLPILVVSKETGRPGKGFPAVADMDAERERVFAHNWFGMKPPSAADFMTID